ncbi:MAG: amidohydrolase family protein [Candidatus Aminicenantales bacterium]
MNKRSRYLVILVAILLIGGFGRGAETIFIRNARIVPIVGPAIENGCLLIQNGKISMIGSSLTPPADAEMIDAQGLSVYPGMVAVMTAVGITGYPGAGDDVDEIGVSTPHMDPFDALNPEDECIEVARIGGVTTVMTAAGTRNVINGKAIVLNLEGNLAEDMVIKRDAAQIFNLGARQQGKYPVTLPGVMAFIRDKLNQTRRYLERQDLREKGGGTKEEYPGSQMMREGFLTASPELEALIPVIKREIPALFMTSNEVMIRDALLLIKEFNLKGILYATGDILKFAGRLKQEKIPIIWAGTARIPERWEPFDLNYHTACMLSSKGLAFAFDQMGWGLGNRNVRNLPVPASISVAHGLSEEEAIRAMTIHPANLLGIGDQVGSLEVGKTANLVLWRGSPVQLSSRVEGLIINGRIIPLESVQTRLRDKFEKIVNERKAKTRLKP